ncbi:MAG: 16S rRNA (cytosine(1402)-N(4))-methyltransferase [Candidatus Marinimicrobia bacterium]|nr:16S rRNA (cytosine(1402)-N(4))-methyltransferase [Candidatus Neomarinimicrobiota bacterium]
MTTLYQHTPVLRDEAVRQLGVSPSGVYVDATCGLGGHSEKICEQLGPHGQLFCFDLDRRALEIANARLTRFTNVHFIQK